VVLLKALQFVIGFIIRGNLLDSHLIDDPARQVSLDFVSASANGFGFSLTTMRTSQTRIIPFDDADATRYGSSPEAVPSLLVRTTIPFKRLECASSMLYATLALFVSHAVIFRSSPPVYRSPFCQF
jgi:hypothetical protein